MLSDLKVEIPSEGVRDVYTDKVSYQIVHDRSTNFWSVKSKDGVLPQVLQGKYTSPSVAITAIKNYSDQYAAVQKAVIKDLKSKEEKGN